MKTMVKTLRNGSTFWSAATRRRLVRACESGAMPPHFKGFTLIELLVVITIIVVLLALLVPAMDKAIYQAELVVCGTNQRAIATAANAYAMGNKRYYPSRPTHYAWDALIIRHPNQDPQYPKNDGNPSVPWDLRPMYKEYMSLEAFVDPLAGDIKVDESNNDDPATGALYGRPIIYSNFRVYSGWGTAETTTGGGVGGVGQTTGYTNYKRMARLGDKWSFIEKLDAPGNGIPRSFGVLASDLDNTCRNQGWAMSGHPDPQGAFEFLRFQNENTTPGAIVPQQPGSFFATISYWRVQGGYVATNVKGDYNYAYSDGSVRRENGVLFDDDRMAKVIETNWSEYAGLQRYAQLPKQ